MVESKTSARRLEEAERTRKAVELRLSRASYSAIAKQVGFADESGARKAVERALSKTRRLTTETAEEVRHLDLSKLDEIELRMTALMRSGQPAAKIGAAKALVSVLKRRAELVGLDVPIKVEHSTADKAVTDLTSKFSGMTNEELDDVERVYERAAARQAAMIAKEKTKA